MSLDKEHNLKKNTLEKYINDVVKEINDNDLETLTKFIQNKIGTDNNDSELDEIVNTVTPSALLQIMFFKNIKRIERELVSDSQKSELSKKDDEISKLNMKMDDITNSLMSKSEETEQLTKKCEELEKEKTDLVEENSMISTPSNQISILKKYDDKIVERDNQIGILKKEIERLNMRISQYETVDHDDEEEDEIEYEEITVKGNKYLFDGEKLFFGEDDLENPLGYKDSKGRYKFYKKK